MGRRCKQRIFQCVWVRKAGSEAVSWESWSTCGPCSRVCLSERCAGSHRLCASQQWHRVTHRPPTRALLHAFEQNLKKKGEAALRIHMSAVLLAVLKTPWPFQLAPQQWCDSESLWRRESEELYSQSSLPYSLLSSADVNEGDCQSWQVWNRHRGRGLISLQSVFFSLHPSVFLCWLHWSSKGVFKWNSPWSQTISSFSSWLGKGIHGHCSVSPGRAALSSHTHWCAWCDTAFTSPCCSHSAPGQSQAGHLLFWTWDTSGELSCPLLMAGNNLSDARVPNCVWDCSCCNHDVPDSDTAGHSLCTCMNSLPGTTQWNSPLGHKVPSSPVSHG